MTTNTDTPQPTHILGAGWAGMLAAEFWPGAEILERDSDARTLTGTTGAFIRCRHPNAALILQAPHRTAQVHRCIATVTWDTHTDVQPLDSALYARKVAPGGALAARSINRCTGGAAELRHILLPEDLVAARQRAGARVHYDTTPEAVAVALRAASPKAPVVSTLPMHLVLTALTDSFDAPPAPELFRGRPCYVLETELARCEQDFCWTVYVPSSFTDIARITITGGRAIVELVPSKSSAEFSAQKIEDAAELALFQLFSVAHKDIKQWRWHQVSKFSATPEYVAWAREVVYLLSVERGIYSLGRAATGRPGVLIDDLYNDCRVINKLMRARAVNDYNSALSATREVQG